jgi:thiol-disulfide isomerase/thioredoxin
VFLNFWATWCPPCRAEMPSMERLYQKLKGQGLVILAVDLQEDAKSVQKFVSQHKLTFPILLDSDGRIGGTYGARSIPTSYIVDRKGNVLGGTVGGREWDTPEMIAFFTRLLAAE